jgi:Amt family ammonium transporter
MNARLPLIVAPGFSPLAQAASDEAINTGWLVLASVLVFFMQAGFVLMFAVTAATIAHDDLLRRA